MAINLAELRKRRDARLAKTKALAEGESREYCNTDALAQGVTIWWPKRDVERMLRVVQFQVTKSDNMAGDAVGDFASVRRYKTHRNIGVEDVTYMCPTSYGKPCPICEHYNTFSDEEKKNYKTGTAKKFKPREVCVFNALIREPDESGKDRTSLRVVRGGYYASYKAILDNVKSEAKFNPKNQDEIFLFDDLELGYWLRVRFAHESAMSGGSVEFMHITQAALNWREPKKMVPEKAFPLICDLDELLPAPLSYGELKKLLLNATTSVEDHTYADEVDDAIARMQSPVVVTHIEEEEDTGIPYSTPTEMDIEQDVGTVVDEAFETVTADSITTNEVEEVKTVIKRKAPAPKVETTSVDTSTGVDEDAPFDDFDDFDEFD